MVPLNKNMYTIIICSKSYYSFEMREWIIQVGSWKWTKIIVTEIKINPRVSFIVFVWSNFAARNQSSFKIIFSLKESKYEWHWKWKPRIFLLLCRGTQWQKSRDPNTQNRCLFLKRADNAFLFSGCSNYVIKQMMAWPLNM